MFELLTRARIYTLPAGADAMAALQSRLAEVRARIAVLTEDIEWRQSFVDQAEADAEAARAAIATAEDNVATMEERSDDATAERIELEARMDQLDQNIAALETALASEENDTLRHRLEDAVAERGEVEARWNYVFEIIAAVNASWQRHRAEVKEAQSTLALAEATLASQAEVMARLGAERDALIDEEQDLVATIGGDE